MGLSSRSASDLCSFFITVVFEDLHRVHQQVIATKMALQPAALGKAFQLVDKVIVNHCFPSFVLNIRIHGIALSDSVRRTFRKYTPRFNPSFAILVH